MTKILNRVKIGLRIIFAIFIPLTLLVLLIIGLGSLINWHPILAIPIFAIILLAIAWFIGYVLTPTDS